MEGNELKMRKYKKGWKWKTEENERKMNGNARK